MNAASVLLIGGGMIAHDQILPSLLHLRRLGLIDELEVVTRSLGSAQRLSLAFPGGEFRCEPGNYAERIGSLDEGGLVVVALPDAMHYEAVMAALHRNQHVLCVKPLVLSTGEARAIEKEAAQRGLLVAVEYHKRLDDRSLMARRRYREGWFGEFKLGTAHLMEKWYYRHSNFQNWCTTDQSDAFTYIGCHYVDLVHFITGLLPVSVSVYGIKDKYPNGNEGYLWTDARVIWNNGACLNVQNTLSFPDDGPGSNSQGLTLYCAGENQGAFLRHSDQYRGMEYCYTDRPAGAGTTVYSEPSSDYFQYVDVGDGYLTPVGYGYRSIELSVRKWREVRQRGAEALRQIDEAGMIATPANSRYNEGVIEAARLSLAQNGKTVDVLLT